MPLGFFFMLSRWFYNTYNQPFKYVTVRYGAKQKDKGNFYMELSIGRDPPEANKARIRWRIS